MSPSLDAAVLARAPACLVSPAGEVTLGLFSHPVVRPNLEDAPFRVAGFALPRALVPLRFKAWQHFLFTTPDVLLGVAVLDLGYLRATWVSAVTDPWGRDGQVAAGRHVEHRRRAPWLDVRVAPTLEDDRTWVRASGYAVEVHNHLSEGSHHVLVQVDGRSDRPAVGADLRIPYGLQEHTPLEVCMPVGPDRYMYSHKAVAATDGWIRVGERTFPARPEDGFVAIDVHRALYPHHTWWRWATFAGRDATGRLVGLNLTRNPNEEDRTFHENGLWVDGRLHLLTPPTFTFDEADPLLPWHIGTEDGDVDLVFTPRGRRMEDVGAGPLRTRFQQPWGTFAGHVRGGGETVEIRDLHGVCEDHDAWW